MDINVGAAAKAARVSPKAVRLWEAKGLLPPAGRTEAGYRLFDQQDLGELKFIRQAKTLGLTLSEIKDILDLQRGGAAPCGRVIELLDAHIADIDQTLDELRQLRSSLSTAKNTARASQRRGESAVVCRIIENQQSDQN